MRGKLGGSSSSSSSSSTGPSSLISPLDGSATTTTSTSTSTSTTTLRPSKPVSAQDIRLQHSPRYPPPQGQNYKTVQQAYWRQAAAWLQEWDALLPPTVGGSGGVDATNLEEDADGSRVEGAAEPSRSSSLSSLIPPLASIPTSQQGQLSARWALQQAAHAGHPMAQHYLANAYASGIWPVAAGNATSTNDKDTTEEHILQVFDEWSPTAAADLEASGDDGDTLTTIPTTTTTRAQQTQLTKAFLWWHMAAMGGNMESAMALAHRISELSSNSNSGDATKEDSDEDDQVKSCREVLPYLEAAAHGIVDELEASPNSRAKVLPPMDKHILSQVHMHGGTSSQLDWNNKPHESKEAIQFYHLKATTTPWSARLYSTTTNNKKEDSSSSSSEEPSIDIHAAYTLAHLYHHGVRGVPQNLTQSLMYYEIAANYGHWESAGEAGTFYLWGMGTAQNVDKAQEYFQIGSPFGLEGCRRKHEQALIRKDGSGEREISECDAASLNGMGLLHLLGVPNEIEVDLEVAEKYFSLAKEMGHADAMYHLSMMWLGWKTHFKNLDDLVDDGVSSMEAHDAFPSDMAKDAATGDGAGSKKMTATFALHYSPRTQQVTKGSVPSEIQDAIKLLTLAANKGHLQAKHRLAMIYSEGISIQTAALKYDAVKPSCSKAKALYQWVTDHASVQRSKRLRKAYKAYTAGNLEVALRNYLAAGETGSNIGQVNAAFLLERGTCLGLSPSDCAKASVRLWKAASARGNTEACLRVGDFYYYGRLRGNALPVGPFGWIQYILYPEQYLPELFSKLGKKVWTKVEKSLPEEYRGMVETSEQVEPTDEEQLQHEEMVEGDLSTAAHYYTEAAEKFHSPRANFNLGFMYEWGLGLKQDFPLAKRHYDLAASLNHGREAELAVQIALLVMSAHEQMVKLHVAWKEWQKKGSDSPTSSPSTSSGGGVLSPKANSGVAAERLMGKTAQDIILSHIFNWSSLAVVALGYIVIQLQKIRERRRQRR